ncbi:hypothetical protein JCM14469_17990 [Desulfatiferula olefinivorans]
MDDIDALTKRFKSYIDKVQAAYESSRPGESGDTDIVPASGTPSKKLYTVVSPLDAMTRNVKSVLDALDQAIDRIDALGLPETEASPPGSAGQDVYVSHPSDRTFTDEELEFLVRTFNAILRSSDDERKRLFDDLEKKSDPPSE